FFIIHATALLFVKIITILKELTHLFEHYLYILAELFSEGNIDDRFNKFYFLCSRLIHEKAIKRMEINFIKETCEYLNNHILANDENDLWKTFFKKGNNKERFYQLYKKLDPTPSFVINDYYNFMPHYANITISYAIYSPHLNSNNSGFQHLAHAQPSSYVDQSNNQIPLQNNRNYSMQQGFFSVIQQEKSQPYLPINPDNSM
nr:hypothetical protein [Tatlockia sp.]